MAGQQRQFNPGVSLAGAVDLEALKQLSRRGTERYLAARGSKL